MSRSITLPTVTSGSETYRLLGAPVASPVDPGAFNRVAFAAVHVVADALSAGEPSAAANIDWDATLAFRRHLLSLGFCIAEAMDTAQRGSGLDWPAALELIQRSLRAASPEERERIHSGVGTDQLAPADARSIDDVIRAYLEQLDAVQKAGGRVIMMASRALARVARNGQDYVHVYGKVLAQADRPVILHWLGDMFDPALAGYWGSGGFPAALDTVLAMIEENRPRIDGIKLSLLDAQKEIVLRRRLPQGVRMYTGDDFNYPELIRGDAQGYSDALLGIFDAIGPAAAAALTALGRGDADAYERLMAPTVPLSRLIFRAPTQHYKTGVVFLAWLNGFQDHFVMVGGAQSMRPLPYFAEVFRLADQAGLLRDPDRAVARMKQLCAVYGFSA